MSHWSKETSLRIDLMDLSYLTEDALEPWLKPYTPGFYLGLNEEPVFIKGEYYFTYQPSHGDEIRKQIQDICEIADKPIYNHSGKMVFDPSDKVDFEFTEKPALPYRGFNFIKSVVIGLINNLLKERNYPILTEFDILLNHTEDNLSSQQKLELENYYENFKPNLYELKSLIIDFMNKDYYHTYDVVSKRMMMSVIKGDDFRIEEYYRLKQVLKKYTSK